MKKFNILLFITVIILLLLSGWSIFHQPGYSSEDQFVTHTNIHFEKDTGQNKKQYFVLQTPVQLRY